MTIFGSALGSSPHPPTFPRQCCDPKRTYFHPSTIITYTLLPPPPPPFPSPLHTHTPPNIFQAITNFFDFSWDNCDTKCIKVYVKMVNSILCEVVGRGRHFHFHHNYWEGPIDFLAILTSPLDYRAFDLSRMWITAVTVAILDRH